MRRVTAQLDAGAQALLGRAVELLCSVDWPTRTDVLASEVRRLRWLRLRMPGAPKWKAMTDDALSGAVSRDELEHFEKRHPAFRAALAQQLIGAVLEIAGTSGGESCRVRRKNARIT